ncbi:hypothetical protein H112_02917 [Trichophyton rubrum D6]|uniref:Uncharacterized protein n=2 Tax=Trichophyton rubrum TaxID=5551 RepID=A0A080WHF8_TRIRC|nr:uncharacterized protein TERG_12302 [Trichophyton rubrum CBS 118892]EZF24615.1 hypothetical protein H100_02922 [Trichophyton rubrum MR850]EZF43648.1 hypothetical protein H102_02915 [Trichophyton rubrum CBS 100081]EZF54271.1 hypothetical protein H103_02929 [Trichophyton rubrum CBS 288.86]EZF64889.1 hypothetical protein H104_02907 [Trichophyton rubrum CBS 289.86]EZF86182.1 hypothetical protein H110_02929 [Trichophyton rubrum MR1448]EZF97116.1 hypothetical protein H113_02927 [Trichophyton rubr
MFLICRVERLVRLNRSLCVGRLSNSRTKSRVHRLPTEAISLTDTVPYVVVLSLSWLLSSFIHETLGICPLLSAPVGRKDITTCLSGRSRPLSSGATIIVLLSSFYRPFLVRFLSCLVYRQYQTRLRGRRLRTKSCFGLQDALSRWAEASGRLAE